MRLSSKKCILPDYVKTQWNGKLRHFPGFLVAIQQNCTINQRCADQEFFRLKTGFICVELHESAGHAERPSVSVIDE